VWILPNKFATFYKVNGENRQQIKLGKKRNNYAISAQFWVLKANFKPKLSIFLSFLETKVRISSLFEGS